MTITEHTCYRSKRGKAFWKKSQAIGDNLRLHLQTFEQAVKQTPIYPLRYASFTENRIDTFKSALREFEALVLEYQKAIEEEIHEATSQ